jgi:hypothetical protein
MSIMDYSGKKVSFINETEPTTAELVELLGAGATSVVYSAVIYAAEDGNADPRYFAVKIPKAEDTQKSDMLNEKDVLISIARSQRQKDQVVNVPYCYQGHIEPDHQEVLILEYIPRQYQWLNAADKNPDFLRYELYEAAHQACQLFRVVNDLDIDNRDIKIENFNWKDDRFVFLDWNRCFPKVKNKEFSEPLYDVLITYIFQTIARRNLPSPLPPVDDDGQNLWPKDIERPIRRLLVSRNQKPLNYEITDSVLSWHLLLLDKISNQVDSLELFQKIIDNSSISDGEKLERCKDLLEAIKSRHSGDTAFDLVLKQINAEILLLDQSISVIDVDEQLWASRNLIMNVNPSQALEILSGLIDNIPRLKIELKDLFLETLIAETVKEAFNEYGLAFSHEVTNIISLLKSEKEPDDISSSPEFIEFLKSQNSLINDYWTLLGKIDEIDTCADYVAKEKLIQETRSMIKAIIERLSPNLKKIFSHQKPDWDLKKMTRIIKTQKAFQEKEAEIKALENKVVEMVSDSHGFTIEMVKEVLVSSKINFLENRILFDIYQISVNLEARNYRNALEISKKLGELPILEKSLKEMIISDCEAYSDKTLYSTDINQLNNVLPLIIDQDNSKKLDSLKERISVAKNANPENLQDLQTCLRLHLEPWAANARISALTVTNLMTYAELNSIQKRVLNHQERIESGLPDASAINLHAIYEPMNDSLKKLESDREDLARLQDEVNGQINQLEGLNARNHNIRNRLEEIRRSLVPFLSSLPAAAETGVEFSDNSVITFGLVNWISSYLMRGREEDFEKIEKILVAFSENIRLDHPLRDFIVDWKLELTRINSLPNLQKKYIDWIDAIRRRDVAISNKILAELNNEEGAAIYQFLAMKHHSLFGKHQGREEEFAKLFNSGKLQELSEQLDRHSPKSEMERTEVEAWRAKIKFIRSLQQFYRHDKHELGKLGPIIADILQDFVPNKYDKLSKISN